MTTLLLSLIATALATAADRPSTLDETGLRARLLATRSYEEANAIVMEAPGETIQQAVDSAVLDHLVALSVQAGVVDREMARDILAPLSD